jgi:hypothetical protein
MKKGELLYGGSGSPRTLLPANGVPLLFREDRDFRFVRIVFHLPLVCAMKRPSTTPRSLIPRGVTRERWEHSSLPVRIESGAPEGSIECSCRRRLRMHSRDAFSNAVP